MTYGCSIPFYARDEGDGRLDAASSRSHEAAPLLGPVRAKAAAALLLGAWCAAASHAAASAWNRAAGEGVVILDYGSERGDAAFDARGRLAPARRYDKGEAAAYVEYGATDALMLLARPTLDRVAVGSPDGGRYAGVGGASLGAQWQALVFGPAVFAVQGSFGVPGSTARGNPAVAGNTFADAELRLLGGVSVPVPFRPFLDVQAAYRVRSGGASAEWRADVTAGFYPTERLLLLGQAFTSESGASGADPGGARWAARLDLKAVYALTPAWAVQVGAFQTVAGRDSLRERGLTAGIWYTF